MFGFVYLTFMYALAIVMLIGFLCFLICVCCLAAKISACLDAEAASESKEDEVDNEEESQQQLTSIKKEIEEKS